MHIAKNVTELKNLMKIFTQDKTFHEWMLNCNMQDVVFIYIIFIFTIHTFVLQVYYFLVLAIHIYDTSFIVAKTSPLNCDMICPIK